MPEVADPPPAITKWVDLLGQIYNKGLLPIVIIALALWFIGKQQDIAQRREEVLRGDLKEARGETSKAFERCSARVDQKAADIKEQVKSVAAEVRETKSAVQQQQQQPAAAPPTP